MDFHVGDIRFFIAFSSSIVQIDEDTLVREVSLANGAEANRSRRVALARFISQECAYSALKVRDTCTDVTRWKRTRGETFRASAKTRDATLLSRFRRREDKVQMFMMSSEWINKITRKIQFDVLKKKK